MDEQTYYQLFPTDLHSQVDEVIDYLTYFPFEKPKYCVHCGSKSFYSLQHPLQKIDNYRCNRCNMGFNRLTGTLFAHCRHVHLWGEFAKARLSGRSRKDIRAALGFSEQAISYRDRVLMQFLKSDYPAVYKWWKPYQYGKRKVILNNNVKSEIDALNHWLNSLMKPKQVLCSSCGHKMHRTIADRPYFVCYRCESGRSLLKDTPLYKLAFAHLWPSFLKLLIQGYGNLEISKRLNISMAASYKWRTAFMAIIKEQQLTHLEEWIIWQRKRMEAKSIIAAIKK